MANNVSNQVGELWGRRALRTLLLGLSITLLLGLMCGCQTLGFYAQAIKGQYELLSARTPIEKLEKSPDTPARLKERFQVVHEIRAFAEAELGLPVEQHYSRYADVHRPFVLWNIQAAPEFSMQPKKWWYPMVGNQQYRGYFSQKSATNYAAALQKDGWDAFVGGVQAYSTLGWFKESVLNTFVFDPDPLLAELIFHELSHQQVFARGDTDFNEAFATTVGQEATRRWLRANRSKEMLEGYERDLARNDQFVGIVMKARRELETLFGDERTEEDDVRATDKRKDIAPEEMRRRKQAIYDQLKADYAALKQQWDGDTAFDWWFSRQLNNAKLNSVAAYHDLVPGFMALLAVNQGDMKKFYKAAEGLADMPRKQRREWLRVLAASEEQEQELRKPHQANGAVVGSLTGGTGSR